MDYTLEKIEATVNIEDYIEDYVDVGYFDNLCRQCSNYDATWSCPSFDFDPYDMWRSYDRIMIYGYRIAYTGDRTEEEMKEVLWDVKKQVSEDLFAYEKKIPGSVSLSAGYCQLCKSCTRPEGRPCRFKDKMRYSIEAIGGNVGKTISELCGVEIEWIEDGKLPDHFVLVGGLLIRDKEENMDIEKTIRNLEKNRFTVKLFKTDTEAADYLDSRIDGKTVGFGDSKTLINMNLYDKLAVHNTVYDPNRSTDNDGFLAVAKKCLTTEVYLTSVNAMSETGEMVNIDGTGNRIAGSLFGHDKVYFVVSTKKIEATLEDAFRRARNIAGPMNAKKYELNTPCVIYGNKVGEYTKCFDCRSPERICNAFTVYARKLNDIDEVEVILIDQPMGF